MLIQATTWNIFLIFHITTLIRCDSINFNVLPLMPNDETLRGLREESSLEINCGVKRNIPCHVWITAKKISPQTIPAHMKNFFNRNKSWKIHLIDDDKMTNFMRSAFNGTRVLWAFELIHPKLGAARADIWRLAVLYVYGGVYIDIDADLLLPLDKVCINSFFPC